MGQKILLKIEQKEMPIDMVSRSAWIFLHDKKKEDLRNASPLSFLSPRFLCNGLFYLIRGILTD